MIGYFNQKKKVGGYCNINKSDDIFCEDVGSGGSIANPYIILSLQLLTELCLQDSCGKTWS